MAAEEYRKLAIAEQKALRDALNRLLVRRGYIPTESLPEGTPPPTRSGVPKKP